MRVQTKSGSAEPGLEAGGGCGRGDPLPPGGPGV
jgi:hypothetical protein